MKSSRLVFAILASALTLGFAAPTMAAPLPPTRDYLITANAASAGYVKDLVAAWGGSVDSVYAGTGIMEVSLSNRSAGMIEGFGIGISQSNEQEFTRSVTPSRPSLDRLDQESLPLDGVFSAPSSENGAGVNIYVVDSGVVGSHEVFEGRVQTGIAFVNTPAGVGIAGTGPGNVDGCDGHGTHVAAIAAGRTLGVAPAATVIPIRVFGCDANNAPVESAKGSDLALAFQWILNHHQVGQPAVVNLSLGTSYVNTGNIDNLIAQGRAEGIVYVGASGNDNVAACTSWPAAVPGVLSVGSFTMYQGNEERSVFSNYGDCVDLHAPGGQTTSSANPTLLEGIVSAWPFSQSGAPSNTSYAGSAGTSQAAPSATGAIARYFSANPTHTANQALTAITSQAVSGKLRAGSLPAGTPNKILYIPKTGYAPSSTPVTPPPAPVTPPTTPVTPPPTPVTPANAIPGVPLNVSLAASGSSLMVTWTAPSDGGTPTGYTVTLTSVDGSVSKSLNANTDARSATFTGGTAGQSFIATVVATNALGTGVVGTSAAVTLAQARASAPAIVKVTFSPSKATVRWAVPKGISAQQVIRYEIRWTTAPGVKKWSTWKSTNKTSYTITKLPRRTTRYAQIRAVTANGASEPTTVSMKTK